VNLVSVHLSVCLSLCIAIYTVSKNTPDVFSYNSRKHCRIFVIFGRNITEKVSSQKMLYFPLHLIDTSALPCKTENTENDLFTHIFCGHYRSIFNHCDVLGCKDTDFNDVGLTQNKGYYAVQDHSRSSIPAPIESPYATSY